MGANIPAQQLADLYAKNFGYLSSLDIAMWINPQLMITAENLRPGAIASAVRSALSIVQSALLNFYDLEAEFLLSAPIAPTFKATVAAGAITGVQVLTGGTNYYTAPTLQIIPSDNGAGGALTATITPSQLLKLQLLQNGGRYTAAPVISFEGGGGTGATATSAIDKSGRVVTLSLTAGGSGWMTAPKVKITGDGCGAAAVASVGYGKVTAITIGAGGANYNVPPQIIAVGGQAEDQRNAKMVTLCAINTVRVLMGNAANIEETTIASFKMADNMIAEVENGGGNFPLTRAGSRLRNFLGLVSDRFNDRG